MAFFACSQILMGTTPMAASMRCSFSSARRVHGRLSPHRSFFHISNDHVRLARRSAPTLMRGSKPMAFMHHRQGRYDLAKKLPGQDFAGLERISGSQESSDKDLVTSHQRVRPSVQPDSNTQRRVDK
jgi:hypothetical protein